MVRLLFALLIVALLLTAVSRMLGVQEKEAPPSPEDTIVGAAYEPYTRARQFGDDYENALDEKRKKLDDQIDDG